MRSRARQHARATITRRTLFSLTALVCGLSRVFAQGSPEVFRPEIDKVWDEQALAEMELPVIAPKYTPKPDPASRLIEERV